MLLFLKLVDETQITTTPEDTSHHNSRKILVLLSLRAIYNATLRNEIPCTTKILLMQDWVSRLSIDLKTMELEFEADSTTSIHPCCSQLLN